MENTDERERGMSGMSQGTECGIGGVKSALLQADYVASDEIATAVFLGEKLGRAILVEGPAGVGKTALGKAWAAASGRAFIRLQCYEGLDEARALYEWDYARQLLYAQLLREKVGQIVGETATVSEAVKRIGEGGSAFFSREFLLPRPLLSALLSETPALLLIDEIDKADPEFEAFLLELLEEWTVTLPEIGAVRARKPPLAILTSNGARELSDALRRRCLHLWISYPSEALEVEILRKRLPGITDVLARKVVGAVRKLREFDLKKPPSLSETLDWARALVLLGVEALDMDDIRRTLCTVLKDPGDERLAFSRLFEVAEASGRVG